MLRESKLGLCLQLNGVERYAMTFLEQTDSWSAKQLAEAEAEIERQKRDWEMNRQANAREEEQRRRSLLDDPEPMLTYSREDASNQVNSGNKRSRRLCLARKRRAGLLEAHKAKLRRKRLRVEGRPEGLGKRKSGEEGSASDSDAASDGAKVRQRNHVAKKEPSPRTRSRGTVSINLWRLDRGAAPGEASDGQGSSGPDGTADLNSVAEGSGSPEPGDEAADDAVAKKKKVRARAASVLLCGKKVNNSRFAKPNLVIRTRRSSVAVSARDASDGSRLRRMDRVFRRKKGSVDRNGLS